MSRKRQKKIILTPSVLIAIGGMILILITLSQLILSPAITESLIRNNAKEVESSNLFGDPGYSDYTNDGWDTSASLTNYYGFSGSPEQEIDRINQKLFSLGYEPTTANHDIKKFHLDSYYGYKKKTLWQNSYITIRIDTTYPQTAPDGTIIFVFKTSAPDWF